MIYELEPLDAFLSPRCRIRHRDDKFQSSRSGIALQTKTSLELGMFVWRMCKCGTRGIAAFTRHARRKQPQQLYQVLSGGHSVVSAATWALSGFRLAQSSE